MKNYFSKYLNNIPKFKKYKLIIIKWITKVLKFANVLRIFASYLHLMVMNKLNSSSSSCVQDFLI